MLLERGAAPNAYRIEYKGHVNTNGEKIVMSNQYFTYTPLYAAILSENTEIVKLLLDSGVNPTEVINLRIGGDFRMIDKIYSAEKLSAEANLTEMSQIFTHFDTSNFHKGILSLIENQPSVVIETITPSEDAYGNKITLSNGWALHVNSDALDLFQGECYLKLTKQTEQFLEITKFSKIPGYLGWASINVMGHAIKLNESGEYLFVPK